MRLHDFQLVLLCIADQLLHQVLHSVDEVLKSHLVLVVPRPHDLDEDEVVIIASHLLTSHAREQGQLGELGGRENFFGTYPAVAVEDSEHVLDYVHLLDFLTLNVQHFLPRIVVLPNAHVSLLLQAAPDKIKRVLYHYLLHIFIDWADFLFKLSSSTRLMLDIEGRIVIRLKQPRVQLLIDQYIDADDMKTLAILLGKGGTVVVFEKGIYACQKFLSQLLYPSSQCPHIDSVLHQFFPNHLQTPLPPLAESITAVLELRMVLVETVIGEVNIRIAEIFLRGLLVILCAETSQALLVEVADIGIQRRDKDIQPKIELFLVDQQGLIYVGLHDPLLIADPRYLTHPLDQGYAVSLASCRRFGDKHTTLLQFLLQGLAILRKEVCPWIKPKLFWPVLPKLIQYESQCPLMAEMRHGWQPIDEHLRGHEVLVLGQGQSRPHYISPLEHLHPSVTLDDGLDQSQLAPAVARIDLDLLLAGRVQLAHEELRDRLLLVGLGFGFILFFHFYYQGQPLLFSLLNF